jgi:hypothetical protein
MAYPPPYGGPPYPYSPPPPPHTNPGLQFLGMSGGLLMLALAAGVIMLILCCAGCLWGVAASVPDPSPTPGYR